MSDTEHGAVQRINPDGLYKSPDFTQVVVASGAVTTIRIAGQVAIDASGRLVGKGDLAAQTEKVFDNIEIGLRAAGASLDHVVHWTVYVAAGQSLGPVVEVYRKILSRMAHPPIVNLLHVAALASPDYLVEIETVALLPEA